MAKIYTRVEGYTGIRASVSFTLGVGETDDPHLISWFRNHGYRVEEPSEGQADTGKCTEPAVPMVAPAQTKRRSRKKER